MRSKKLPAYVKFRRFKNLVVPSGTPKIYGEDLGVSFDDVPNSINKLAVFGPDYGEESQKITLNSLAQEKLTRYKNITRQIACEYCCGVGALTETDGSAACGCAHSIAMRGLAAYLLENHANEYSDEDILAQLAAWKATFFPKQTVEKELNLLVQSGNQDAQEMLLSSELLPDMVGGC